VVRATAAGKPALGVFHGVLWGGTAYLVRYSNKYFILLELSDMLVTFGWMVLGVALVVWLKLEHDVPRRATKEHWSDWCISWMCF
jgi:amino acid permease